jgi:subtilisin family serine protease
MRFTPTRAAAALALAFGILGSSNTEAVRPQPFEGAADAITPKWVPLGIGKAPVTVVVQLAGESVAEQQGNAERRLDRSEKDRIKGRLRAQQDGLRGSIEGMGGRVLARYQASYNGMKVRIARDRVNDLKALPGVVAVRPLQVFRPKNIRGVPFIGTPAVWQSLGIHGEGVKIAIIDTGIDYTHANFGGPGTAAAFALAAASSTMPANPAHFGPLAPRIKGGFDFVGDDYDASADPLPDGTPNPRTVPHPDPNPLDCNGHGSHVAGTAGGSGVTSAGATYAGPYNASTFPGSFNVAPGVAPRADLYALRVFGCDGSTDVVVDAIEWAVDHDMDVINMSLGAPFGSKDDPSAVASTNAARAGVIVVAAAGNEGPNQYIIGSPATAEGSIATAANDPWPTLLGVRVQTTPPTGTGLDLAAINANGHVFTGPFTGPLVVLQDNPATTADEPGFLGSANESLGCSPTAYTFNGIVPGTGQIAVAQRGACARVAKAIMGQQGGAAAVIMTNNAPGLPPFEGPITSNPDTGVPFTVTIPFVGVAGNQAAAGTDSFRLRASPAGTMANLSPIDLANGNYTGFASFSSGGPRTGDSALKPDVTAPGVSILSTGIGTGNAPAVVSGTSMASPLVAGVAALTRQARQRWKVADIKSAIVHTAQPSAINPPGPGAAPYRISRGGAGVVNPAGSTTTQVVANASGGGRFNSALNFGFHEFNKPFVKTKSITLRNNGSSSATFSVSQSNAAGSPHTILLSRVSVTVPRGGEREVDVTLAVAPETAGASNGVGLSFQEVAGHIVFTPQGGSNAGVTLRVPYYMVPRPEADVSTSLGRFTGTQATATITNRRGAIAGDADFYAWGLFAKKSRDRDDNNDTADVRAVGMQSFAFDATNQLLVFAVNTYNRTSNPSTAEHDIFVDVDGDGKHDYIIVGADQGAVQTGVFNGRLGSFVFSTRSGGASINFLAAAPTDSSTVLLPVLSSQLCRTGEPCLNASNPRLTYNLVSFDIVNGGAKEVPSLEGVPAGTVPPGAARFNAWSSSITQGIEPITVAPGATAQTTIAVNPTEAALTPARGLMVVTFDNKSGEDEAQLIEVGKKHRDDDDDDDD